MGSKGNKHGWMRDGESERNKANVKHWHGQMDARAVFLLGLEVLLWAHEN